MTSQTPQSVVVIEGLFTWPSDKPQLIGSRCSSCGTHFFPKSFSCNNPKCKEKKVEEVLLSTRGKLYSYTIQHYPPPPPFKIDEPFSPYGIGLVELPEGVRVLGMLTGCNPDQLKIGMDLELVVERLYQDAGGKEVVTWKFKPV